MRIDGTNWVQPHGPGDPPQPAQKPAPSGEPRIPADDPQTRSALAPYLQKAKACEQIDEQAVAEARKLLQSGQLDTREAVRRAAEALMRLGP